MINSHINFKANRYSILLMFLVVFLGINNYIWLKMDSLPFGPDELGHLENAMTVSTVIRSPLKFFDLETIFPHKWGPLQYLISSLLILIFGYSHQTLVITTTILFLILIILVYFIGKKIRDEKTGLLSAFILSMYPIVFHFSRKYTLEIVMTTAVVLSFYLLLGLNNFENKRKSLFFGISFGLGLLSSSKYLLFIAGPLVFIMVRSLIWDGIKLVIFKRNSFDLIEKKLIYKKRLINILLSFGLGVLICLPWYYNKLDFFLKIKPYLFVGDKNFVRAESDPNYYFPAIFLSLENISFYIKSFFIAQAFPFFAITFALGLILTLKNKPDHNLAMLLLWIGFSYLICSSIKNKTARYTIEYLPAIAIISSLGITKITTKWCKYFILSAIIIIGLSQYLYYSYGERLFSERIKQNTSLQLLMKVYDNGLLKMYEPKEGSTNWSWDTFEHLPEKSNVSRKFFGNKLRRLLEKNVEKTYIFLISDPWSEYIRVLKYFLKIENYDRFLDSKLIILLFHPIHPTEMLEDFIKEMDNYSLIIFLSNNKEYDWPSAIKLGKEIVEVRKFRWPKPEDLKELELDNNILKKLDIVKDKFELVDKTYVEPSRVLIYEDLFINIYQRSD